MQMSLDVAMDRTFSVAEFGQLINDVLNHTFPHDLWIQGEVRDMTRAGSGHVYFTLVDAAPKPGRQPDAALSVVLFEGTKRTINAQIKRSGGGMRIDDGISVRIRGVPDFYAPGGKLSLRMTGIDPAYTLGQLAVSRDRLLRMLADEDLLHANLARPVPGLPLHVGLVTANGSAAKADFLHELEQSDVAFRVAFSPSPVQGSDAAARIAAAIRSCELRGVDVIAVVRGGGARTDLAAFDDEVVARAIAGCSIPVFTGIGHEIDTAVADEVAHLALKTPTACAAHVVGLVREAENTATALWNRVTVKAADLLSATDAELTGAAFNAREFATSALRDADTRAVTAARQVRDLTSSQLDRSSHRLTGHFATARLLSRHRLDNADAGIRRVAQRVGRAGRVGIQAANRRVDNAHFQARLLDPERALARGWSITTDANGAVVRSVADTQTGSQLTTRLADGTIASTVDAATHKSAKNPPAQTKESS